MKKRLFLVLLLIIASNNIKAQPAFIRDSLDNYVNRVLKDWNLPGMAVCVVKDGKVQVMKGFGVRDLKSKLPVNEETLFMIASNSKAFTGTSLAWLDYEKRLSMDDKIIKYMPWFRLYDDYTTNEVTIRDMLCHRLGFETFQSDFLNWGGNLSRKEIIEKMRTYKPVYPFRYKYGYCNAAFLTAGEVIPLVTDTSWDDFLKYRYFVPLNMKRTSTTLQGIANDSNAAKPYTIFKDELVSLDYPNLYNLGPAASINSCIKDMSNWVLTLLDSGRFNGKQIIPFSVINQTRTPQMLEARATNNSTHFYAYGLGFELSDYAGKKVVSHTGGADGFVTSVCLVPEENLGIIVLTNTDANWMYDGLRRLILDQYLGLPYKDISATMLKRYVASQKEANKELQKFDERVAASKKVAYDLKSLLGKYTNPVYGTMEIKLEKGKAIMTFEHHPNLKGNLEYLDGNNFVCNYSSAMYGVKEIPFKVEGGKVLSCSVTVNDFIDFMPYEFVKN